MREIGSPEPGCRRTACRHCQTAGIRRFRSCSAIIDGMPERAIADFYAKHFDPDGLNGRPWQPGRLTHDAFVSNVESALQRSGKWSTTGELRMGGDINVLIETVEVGENSVSEGGSLTPQTKAFRVQVECGIAVTAEYTSLEIALGMLRVFVDLTWGLVAETDAWRGLVFHYE